MVWRLLVTEGPDMGRIFPLGNGDETLVGRGSECDIQLADPAVSKVHCRLQPGRGRIVVVDAGSRWGTRINDQLVTEQELGPGDLLTVGETAFKLESSVDTAAITVLPTDPVAAARAAVSAVRLPSLSPELVEPAESHATAATGDDRGEPIVGEDEADVFSESLEKLVGRRMLRYDILELVARARTGMVFQARDTKKDIAVAVKVFFPQLMHGEQDVRRFLRAIRTMMPLRHENLVALHGAGKTRSLPGSDGKQMYCWMATEFVEGESVAEMILRVGVSGMLDWRHAFAIALDIARALEAASEQSIIHRNITPRNILVRSEDRVAKLGDLMLAKALEGAHVERITHDGELVGDLAYMSPEETGANVVDDGRSDIYRLGATVYATLTGRPPCEAATPAETILKVQREDPVPPTEYHLSIPAQFEGILLKMLAKRPEDRYQHPTQLIADLERCGRYQNV